MSVPATIVSKLAEVGMAKVIKSVLRVAGDDFAMVLPRAKKLSGPRESGCQPPRWTNGLAALQNRHGKPRLIALVLFISFISIWTATAWDRSPNGIAR